MLLRRIFAISCVVGLFASFTVAQVPNNFTAPKQPSTNAVTKAPTPVLPGTTTAPNAVQRFFNSIFGFNLGSTQATPVRSTFPKGSIQQNNLKMYGPVLPKNSTINIP